MREMTTYADTWSHMEVRWDRHLEMWAICAVTADDKEVGEREYYTVQADAIIDAKAYVQSDRCERVEIYTKWGKLSKKR